MPRLTLIAASLAIAVSGCNNKPAVTVSHPPSADLTCPIEPPALTDEQILGDPSGLLDQQFNDDAIIAGRACRDALARVCQWHKDRGNKDVAACRLS
jgi:hypothetical protein